MDCDEVPIMAAWSDAVHIETICKDCRDEGIVSCSRANCNAQMDRYYNRCAVCLAFTCYRHRAPKRRPWCDGCLLFKPTRRQRGIEK